ncbi:efflux RND transporter periplasmic adaptor subunit [Gloeobacter violaceus]|uniref:Gll0875 protein n=1 Tax=Gloeobacter violaceus (strain ATCC 29082 / PCC 7421) TaxID=251221 RepID=Q7NM92_GLOVI|nr:efflux RND transporter periplasmic adaptor subunit [Gloeobacter violaceus]BAC88816.1 gll0875 [Gloeobacter violaceus PCC 7421]
MPSSTTSKVIAGLVVGGLLFGGLFALGLLPRLTRQQELLAAANEAASETSVVALARPTRAAAPAPVRLPGNIQALQETVVNARSDGYLRRRLVDIGDRVRSGQLLAEIDTPELDQRVSELRSTLAQARADLQQQEANLALARTTFERWRTLREERAVSQQDVDERQSAYRAQMAAVEAQRANLRARQADLDRQVALQNFKQVRAPFSGIVTARNVDTGALIAAGSSQNGLFRVAKTERLRIFIDVPQTFAPAIRAGQSARVSVQEYPRPFEGRVTRTAGALDPAARTLRTEVQLDNRNDRLLPGMYAQVEIAGRRVSPPLTVPANTLLVRAGSTQVAVVGSDSVVHLRRVGLGRDLGETVEIVSGLVGSERLVVNPGDEIAEGKKVEVAAPHE